MSVFADEWRACLREHYMHVVREGDQKTLASLTLVMYEVGFSDDELRELQVRATMRAEDMPDDFVPDMHLLDEPAVYPAVVAESASDDDPQDDTPPTYEEALEETQAEAAADAPESEDESHDPDAPQQLSLF